jgi:hypothetical protein
MTTTTRARVGRTKTASCLDHEYTHEYTRIDDRGAKHTLPGNEYIIQAGTDRYT